MTSPPKLRTRGLSIPYYSMKGHQGEGGVAPVEVRTEVQLA